jgi:hypothetical protein
MQRTIEVALNLAIVAADEFPVNLIEVIGLEDDGRNDALTRSGLHRHIDTAEAGGCQQLSEQ